MRRFEKTTKNDLFHSEKKISNGKVFLPLKRKIEEKMRNEGFLTKKGKMKRR